jgi:hypothetical protein
VVVTLIAVYLGWAMNWIRQRHAFLRLPGVLYVAGKTAVASDVTTTFYAGVDAPWQLRMFGEEGIGEIGVSAESPELVSEGQRLFPEAGVGVLVTE